MLNTLKAKAFLNSINQLDKIINFFITVKKEKPFMLPQALKGYLLEAVFLL